MSRIKAIDYDKAGKSAWDAFVARAKNSVFLFHRDYLEYHIERFPDASLMFHDDDGRLVALLPATICEGTLSSHAGLTFGGVISDDTMKASVMLEIFDALRDRMRERGLKTLLYKAVPHIYHRYPAEEDLYALFRNGGRLVRRDLSSSIFLPERLSFSDGRKWGLKQAQKHGLEVERSSDFAAFMAIEARLLDEKHNRRPVHTADELEMLARRFPENIKLFVAHCNGDLVAGVVMYESKNVAHAQYIAANEEGKRTGALDLILDRLINEYYRDTRYFDFGISTEDNGRYLNSGLIGNKQSFGARAIVYDFYEIELD